MPKLFRSVSVHEPKKHGTTIGRKPIFSTMNKHKRRSFKKYRGHIYGQRHYKTNYKGLY